MMLYVCRPFSFPKVAVQHFPAVLSLAGRALDTTSSIKGGGYQKKQKDSDCNAEDVVTFC